MPLVLSEMSAADFPRAFEILSEAFQDRQPFMNQFYPRHHTQQGREDGAKRLLAMRTDPNTTFLKVVDAELGLIIAMAKWSIYSGEVPHVSSDFSDRSWWAGGKGDIEYAKTIATEFFKLRNEALDKSKGKLVSTDPAHMRRGAGALLMEWGVSKADELNLGAVVEGSSLGAPLYQRFGFVAKRNVELEMPDPWKHLPKEVYYWMERPRKDGSIW